MIWLGQLCHCIANNVFSVTHEQARTSYDQLHWDSDTAQVARWLIIHLCACASDCLQIYCIHSGLTDVICFRYADVLVHRLLAASLGLAPLPESARDRAGVHALTDNLNTRHRNAQMAGRASVELHTLIFFKDRTIIADARITRVIPLI